MLAAYLTLHFPGGVILIQYADDILLVSVDAHHIRVQTTMLMDKMRTAGWVISTKSQAARSRLSDGCSTYTVPMS